MRKFIAIFFGVGIISMMANVFGQNSSPASFSVLSESFVENEPIVIFVHKGSFFGIDCPIRIPGFKIVEFNYDFLEGTEILGKKFLQAFETFRAENPGNKIVIVAHCYGGSVVAEAVEEATPAEAEVFKDVPVLFLAPVAFAGSRWAIGAGEDGPQGKMKFIADIGLPDFREISRSQDPLGPVVARLMSRLPVLKARVKSLIIMVERDDYEHNTHVPKKDSPELFKRNFGIVMDGARIIPSAGVSDPHMNILTREETIKAIKGE